MNDEKRQKVEIAVEKMLDPKPQTPTLYSMLEELTNNNIKIMEEIDILRYDVSKVVEMLHRLEDKDA